MITVQLGQAGGKLYDITPRLAEDTDLILSQELERDAFQRVVEDVHLKVSNIDGFLSDKIFRGQVGVQVFEVYVRDNNRLIFNGRVNNESIRFDANELWITFDAFSLTKSFWDRAKNVKIMRPGVIETGPLFVTVKDVLERELRRGGSDLRWRTFADLVYSITVNDGLGDRQIRYCGDGGEDYGNAGRYCDLDPNTTVYDLLTAMCLQYNAELFIDPENWNLVFQRRYRPGTSVVDLSGTIIEDATVDISFVDRVKYDYIYAIFGLTSTPDAPAFDKFVDPANGLQGGFTAFVNESEQDVYFSYTTVSVFPDGTESPASLSLTIKVPASTFIKNVFDNHGSNPVNPKGDRGVGSVWTGKGVSIKIPKPVPGAIITRLYRTELAYDAAHATNDDYGGRSYYLTEFRFQVGYFSGDSTTYIDGAFYSGARVRTDRQLLATTIPDPLAGWVGYDEGAGTWIPAIRENSDSSNAPQGKILNAVPKLNFVSRVTGSSRQFDAIDIFAFFGSTLSIGAVESDFQNLLQTVRLIRCRVALTGFRPGDQVVLGGNTPPFSKQIDFPQKLLVKKAAINLLKEYTDLEIACL